MNASKQTLYDPEWQALRVSLLARNQRGAGGGFNSLEGTKKNISRLQGYLGSSPSVDKLWRVLNLLNAVRMGNSGQGSASSDRDKEIIRYRDKVAKQFHAKEKKYSPPSDDVVRRELRLLSDQQFQDIWNDLSRRRKTHKDSPHRPELSHFLELMQEVKGERNPNK